MGWENLLVGNGMSINVSSYFAYDSLYEEACGDFDGSLDDDDIAIFEEFGTTNFEAVLAKLRDGITLAGILGRSRKPYRQRFRSVQAALGAAVRRVHLEWTEVPSETLAAIKAEMRRYDAIFSTSIDDLHGPCLVVLSAGGVFRTGWRGMLDQCAGPSSLKRAEALLYRQTTAFRTRTMIERFKVWEATPPGQEPPPFARRGVLFRIASTLQAPERWARERPERLGREDPEKLAQYKTTFNKIEPEVAEALMHRGWWLAGATLCAYHTDLLAGELPVWRDLPPARLR